MSSISTTSVRFPNLAKPTKLGALSLRNRTIMASMARNRAVPASFPSDAMATFYAQRAGPSGAGLVLTDATMVSPQGTEWGTSPGLWTEEHAKAWKKVTDAVHQQGGLIMVQLYHVGRCGHPDMPIHKLSGQPLWAPSAIAARGGQFRDLPGEPGYPTPTPIPDPTVILDEFTHAAKMAILAGFDGVELHCANGYLVDQFLSDTANFRTDKWGGSVENRVRFGLEAVRRLIEVWGADRVGAKVSPAGGYNDSYHTTPESRVETYKTFITELDALNLAYIQIAGYNAWGDPKHGGVPQGYPHDMIETYGPLIKKSKLIVNQDYDGESAEKVVKEGKAEAVVFARNYIANPDYYKRIEEGIPLNASHMETWYPTGTNLGVGYTDYPFAPEVLA
ncbi:hypothetical protein IAR55_002665 [Kwoniella newhampshirensis]|uniref:NADH:flavin oxidoreductase/NADH oxidase N-terminal domain-containing protein n=1 Tax=Kwoniella newhampshirensis TaxID=1651941 RepID=A0AAW0YRL4_9TREE